ncbi:membrane-associated protease RseP (regulator of RpoE activity) [Kitasatospora sp. SolWspMP-SS2h]|uniref:M50 family metallopeptidase n=1 Tax=Kitasatospora sp. SolWspMP-SS2h TaxID=1305729 RepID=UPI000DB91C1D|nr:site-2 protease family protein [Kitasatospora sp. SolWspMP-SS2h]RAJ32306.1 membrane-associated protease RseP (regulator of RpoE activity) [Kitasatospora sp. SolWspMP-SS2h]
MDKLMWVLGVLIFVVGLLFSIAWHELGHLSTAKLFGIRVPQYMVGFGRTIWSTRRGETEYGLKAIPFGGYIRMIGMFPPGADGRIAKRSSSPWRSMIEDAREASYEELQPGDETRLFYTRAPWKRVIVMFAGPGMNLILSLGLFLALFMGIGVQQAVPTVQEVSECVVPVSAKTDDCGQGAEKSPANLAGLRAGDTVLGFGGVPIHDYPQLQNLIRDSAGRQVDILVRHRDGTEQTLSAAIKTNTLQAYDADNNPVKGQTVTAGFLGITPATGVHHMSLGESTEQMTTMARHSVESLTQLPGKIPGLWHAVVDGTPRDADSPIGMVGAARLGGDVFSMDLPATQRLAFSVQLLAGINLMLFLFNMLPLLPLDGGHIAGALWESLRRNLAKLLRRPDPGPFDVARLMPLAYVVAGVFICFTGLVMAADIVNPVRIN